MSTVPVANVVKSSFVSNNATTTDEQVVRDSRSGALHLTDDPTLPAAKTIVLDDSVAAWQHMTDTVKRCRERPPPPATKAEAKPTGCAAFLLRVFSRPAPDGLEQ